jgi:hypothetical protein
MILYQTIFTTHLIESCKIKSVQVIINIVIAVTRTILSAKNCSIAIDRKLIKV